MAYTSCHGSNDLNDFFMPSFYTTIYSGSYNSCRAFFAFVILNFARRQIFYTLTNQRCIVTSTFILTKKNFIPYNRIADVNLNQNLIERCLGLARVVLYTQGDNKKTPKLVGMRFNDAEELFNRVNLILNKKSEDLV